MEDDVARLRLQACLLEHMAERHALPFADAAPALDAIVAGDLRARRHGAEIGERELGRAARPGRPPSSRQSAKPFAASCLIGGIVGRRAAVRPKAGESRPRCIPRQVVRAEQRALRARASAARRCRGCCGTRAPARARRSRRGRAPGRQSGAAQESRGGSFASFRCMPASSIDPISAGDHRAHIVDQTPESSTISTCTSTKSDDERRGDEMDGARRLPAAEEIEQPGEGGVHRRRHGQAGEDQRGNERRR